MGSSSHSPSEKDYERSDLDASHSICGKSCCVKCGRDIPEGARFCPWCGKKNPAVIQRQKPRTRGNGQGTVYKDSRSGKWIAQVTVGWYDGRRRRRQKGGFKTKKEALEYLPRLQNRSYAAERDVTVSAIWEACTPSWFSTITHDSEQRYRTAFERLKPLWNAKLPDLIAQDWQEVIDEYDSSYDICNRMKIVCSQLYKFALAQGWTDVDMSQYIRLPKKKSSRRDSFTREEIDRLWQSWSNGCTWTAYILIMIYTGMRPGELQQMKLADVHLDDLYMVGGIKTEAGRNRMIGFPLALKPVVEWAVNNGRDGMLCPYDKNSFYPEYDKALQAAGIRQTPDRDLTPHCCRHTFASLANAAGIPLSTTQHMMGHSDPSVTAGYTHVHDAQLEAAWQTIYVPDRYRP